MPKIMEAEANSDAPVGVRVISVLPGDPTTE